MEATSGRREEQQQLTIFYNGDVCVCDVTELQVPRTACHIPMSFEVFLSRVDLHGLIRGAVLTRKKLDIFMIAQCDTRALCAPTKSSPNANVLPFSLCYE